MKNIPYGSANFCDIREKDQIYIDRTSYIRILEDMAIDKALFIRPRRFGKSLWISIMSNYYDVAKKDEFETLFGDLDIGRNPTPDHNKYVVIDWDFSRMSSRGTVDEIESKMNNTLNSVLKEHLTYYSDILHGEVEINSEAINTLGSFLSAVRKSSLKSYLLIDEYDNFANEVMISEAEIYHGLVKKDGPLKTLYKGIKEFLKRGLLSRLFITGVSPVVMSDITSGMNICDNIYLEQSFNSLCGFTEAEVMDLAKQAVKHCKLDISKSDQLMEMMKTWYNGYIFSPNSKERVYNPTLVLYFIKHFVRNCTPPDNMLDNNLAMDEGKLEYIGKEISGKQAIVNVLQTNKPITIPKIEDRFTLSAMLDQSSQDYTFMVSYLYYFGMLTIVGKSPIRYLLLEPPNLVVKNLYVNQVLRYLLPAGVDRSESAEIAANFFIDNNLNPIIKFVEERLFPVFSNRDYRWMDEFALKVVFTTLIFNDINYALFSEAELSRGYADLCLILRPDARDTELFDLLFEFKYVEKSKIKNFQKMSEDVLKSKGPVENAFDEAKEQLGFYSKGLIKKFGKELKLKKYAVVSIGFDRLLFEEVTDQIQVQTKNVMKKAGKRWTKQEENDLIKKYKSGINIQKLSENFGRSESAIRKRLSVSSALICDSDN